MAITHFLFRSNFTFHFPSNKWHNRNNIGLKRNNYCSPCCIKPSPKTQIKCFIMTHKPEPEKSFGTNINGVIWRSMENVMKALQISMIAGALLFLYDHHHGRLALADSGGKMSDQAETFSSSEVYNTQTSSPVLSSSSEIHSRPIGSSVLEYAHMILLLTWGTFTLLVLPYTIIRIFNSNKRSVLKLQVGVLGTYRSLQSDIKRIVAASHSNRLRYVLQDVALALLRHPNYCISGYSSVDVSSVFEGECEQRFNHLCIEERSKLYVVDANNIEKKSATSQSCNDEYIVVTVIVYVQDVCELPPVKSSTQLKIALQKLACIPERYILKVQVFWNPLQENDRLTSQELLEDYPLLHPI